MAQIGAQMISKDEEFRRQAGRLLRSGPIPVSVLDEKPSGTSADVILVDARSDTSSAMALIERLKAGYPGAAIFAAALVADPEMILTAMRAGASEFFTWPPVD